MGTAAVALIAFAVVIGASFTAIGDLTGISASSADSLRASWSEAERIVDSNIEPTSASSTGTDVDVVISNSGRLKYAEPTLSEWVVIVRYDDGGGTSHIEYLSYAETLSTGSWTVQQIYLDQSTLTTEVYEPDVLNPNEEMVVRARLANTPGAATVNQITVSPPEGPRKSVHFNG